ncbi:MAG: hypothetical protein ACLQDQ_12150 [Myxococcaceae bacterium]
MRAPEHRDARIAELQARLRARRASFVRAPVALVCLLGALYLLFRELPDVVYALSSSEAVTLGREGDYRLEAPRSNRYVQVHGTPAARAFWGQDRQGPFLVVGLLDTPLLVRRAPLPSEAWTVGRPPPPPAPTPFAVRGRLLSEAEAPAYREAFAGARQLSGLRPVDGQLWVVLEGERPRQDWGAVAAAVLLGLFAAFNGWLLFDALRRR